MNNKYHYGLKIDTYTTIIIMVFFIFISNFAVGIGEQRVSEIENSPSAADRSDDLEKYNLGIWLGKVTIGLSIATIILAIIIDKLSQGGITDEGWD